jgi:hypothetical protein
MSDADRLRAALETIRLPNLVAQVDKFREEAGWSKERLDAAFAVLRRERESNPNRSHSVEDWLREVVEQNPRKL